MSTTTTKSAGAAQHASLTRELQLANPLMSGDDVRLAQQALAQNPFGDFHPGTPDGQYGPTTAAATKQAKWAVGYPDAACDEGFGEVLLGYLQGQPLPADFQARREARQHTVAQHGGIRDKVVANAKWGIAHEPEIHYQESRPIQGGKQPFKLPLTVDCSGFVTDCYEWAGGPDPNGLGFNGQGYTGTMLKNCRQIAQSAVQPGDLVIWGPFPGHHVAIVLEPGSDPLLASHGQEKGPIEIRFSVESQYQPTPATWLACLV